MFDYNPWWRWFLPYYSCKHDYAYPRTIKQEYFRPSCFSPLNMKDMSNIISDHYNEDYAKITLPKNLFIHPKNSIINFYSILREASNLPPSSAPGGSVGYEKVPYPIAYNFLSKSYQKKLPYNDFVNSFFHTGHINLLKLMKDDTLINNSNINTYLVELETIKTGSVFHYSYGWIHLENENGNYKINNIELFPEDFFYPAYHGWLHNAEKYVENWYKQLIDIQYPTIFNGYTKKIYVKGTDENYYMFKFVHLTNGTDIEVGKYKLYKGQWTPIKIDRQPITLEAAMEKIKSNKELEKRFIDNPKDILEELGVNTSELTITKGTPSELEGIRGTQVCVSIGVAIGASVGKDIPK